MTCRFPYRLTAAAIAAFVLVLAAWPPAGSAIAADDATPAPAFTCAAATPAATPPMAGMSGMDMEMGTPMAGMAMDASVEFDQLYIDMMIPHHASILAMAEAALPRLTDERLRTIARAILATQAPEIAELRDLRDDLYGNPDPVPMDAHQMDQMMAAMPSMPGTMTDMAAEMDAATQVAAICAAADPDLAFIALAIPHHQSAIAASEDALERAVHAEIRAFAPRVIAAQTREIRELEAVRAELTGTPVAG